MTISASAGWVIGLKTKQKPNIFWAFFFFGPFSEYNKGRYYIGLNTDH